MRLTNHYGCGENVRVGLANEKPVASVFTMREEVCSRVSTTPSSTGEKAVKQFSGKEDRRVILTQKTSGWQPVAQIITEGM